MRMSLARLGSAAKTIVARLALGTRSRETVSCVHVGRGEEDFSTFCSVPADSASSYLASTLQNLDTKQHA